MSAVADEIAAPSEAGLSASVQVLPLPPGLYLFSVSAGSPSTAKSPGSIPMPAVSVAAAPGTPAGRLDFLAGAQATGAWLFAKGDLLVARVNDALTQLILTSMRGPTGSTLSIKVERLDARVVTEAAIESTVPLQIVTHIRSRGDLTFANAEWAGQVAPGLWIESFGILPLQRLAGRDIEYKGLSGNGIESPWTSDGRPCGTRGMAVPLVGFAIRLKPGPAMDYDCEYSGYFASGVTVGPFRNGAPCRAVEPNDPLEGLQVRLIRRAGTARPR